MDLSLESKLVVIGLIILSLGAHEAAHGWVALKCGDTTARDLGRITLNPIPHIDLFMTIILPTILMLTTGFIFGGAKPVPVNFYNLRRPYRDMALVALAGPFSNFLIALVFYFVWHLISVNGWYVDKQLFGILYWSAFWNLVIAAFNLFPIPPLDGSRVLAWLLPSSLREPFVRLESFGMLLVFGLLITGVLHGPLFGALNTMFDIIRFIVTAGGTW